MGIRSSIQVLGIFLVSSGSLFLYQNCGEVVGSGSFQVERHVGSSRQEVPEFLFLSRLSVEGDVVAIKVPFRVVGETVVVDGDMGVGLFGEILPGDTVPEPGFQLGLENLVLTPEGKETVARFSNNSHFHFSKGILPYVIDSSNPSYRTTVIDRMTEFNQALADNQVALELREIEVILPGSTPSGFGQFAVNIKIVPDGSPEVDGSHCGLYVSGKFPQIIIPVGCLTNGQLEHKLLHAVGLTNEHQRPDRDDFIAINFDRIDADVHDQFRVRGGAWFGTPYNVNSIMHYRVDDTFISLKEGGGSQPSERVMTPGDIENLGLLLTLSSNPDFKRELQEIIDEPSPVSYFRVEASMNDDTATFFWGTSLALSGIQTYEIFENDQMIYASSMGNGEYTAPVNLQIDHLYSIVAIAQNGTRGVPSFFDLPAQADNQPLVGDDDNGPSPLVAGECVDTPPMNDGWGWDGLNSCRIGGTQAGACVDVAPVGDGWGWNGVASCQVGDNSVAECIDNDGDGWGWDGVASCRVQ